MQLRDAVGDAVGGTEGEIVGRLCEIAHLDIGAHREGLGDLLPHLPDRSANVPMRKGHALCWRAQLGDGLGGRLNEVHQGEVSLSDLVAVVGRGQADGEGIGFEGGPLAAKGGGEGGVGGLGPLWCGGTHAVDDDGEVLVDALRGAMEV